MLMPIYEDLKTMHANLMEMSQNPTPTPHDLHPIREKLAHVDAIYHEGRFDVGADRIPSGEWQCQVVTIVHVIMFMASPCYMERCYQKAYETDLCGGLMQARLSWRRC